MYSDDQLESFIDALRDKAAFFVDVPIDRETRAALASATSVATS